MSYSTVEEVDVRLAKLREDERHAENREHNGSMGGGFGGGPERSALNQLRALLIEKDPDYARRCKVAQARKLRKAFSEISLAIQLTLQANDFKGVAVVIPKITEALCKIGEEDPPAKSDGVFELPVPLDMR